MLGSFSCGVRRRKHRTGTPSYGAEPGNARGTNCCTADEYARASHEHSSTTYEHTGAAYQYAGADEYARASHEHSSTTYEHTGAAYQYAGADEYARAPDKHPCPDEHSDSADTDSRANGDAGAYAYTSSAYGNANKHPDTALYSSCTGRGPA